MNQIFETLQLPKNPVLLAPLAGVSDYPFRRVCSEFGGADLTYVEMLSATAVHRKNHRTLGMMKQGASEKKLGVQITGSSPDELGKGVAVLNEYSFDTIDINMGCPVRKVVGQGAGSAIVRNPETVYQMVRAAKKETSKPVTAKIRIGWDRSSLNYLEVAQAAESAGSAWLTVHGRTRNEDYSKAVDLSAIAEIKKSINIPVIGNGNILTPKTGAKMMKLTEVDGLMVARGALGNPWLFRHIKNPEEGRFLSLEEWYKTVKSHIKWQIESYGHTPRAILPLRKHLLWYCKGWPCSTFVREQINSASSLETIEDLLDQFVDMLERKNHIKKDLYEQDSTKNSFNWNPSYDTRELYQYAAPLEP